MFLTIVTCVDPLLSDTIRGVLEAAAPVPHIRRPRYLRRERYRQKRQPTAPHARNGNPREPPCAEDADRPATARPAIPYRTSGTERYYTNRLYDAF